jgi:hypothetical protein
MHTFKKSLLTAIALLSMNLLSLSYSALGDTMKIGPARQAGLLADKTQILDMIAIVRDRSANDPALAETSLHSLAQLGATEAIPDIETLTQTGKDQNLVNFATAARAHLLAESVVSPDAADMIQAKEEVSRFYSELNKTPADINTGVSKYLKSLSDHPTGPDIAPHYPIELFAMRELADMAYHSSYPGFVKLPDMAQVNFTLDTRSALKVWLAPLSAIERATWLVKDLSGKKILTDAENAEMQLAGDLGAIISPLAAAKVLEMDHQRGQYSSAGFSALFRVLTAAGRPEKAVLDRFKSDADSKIAHYARHGGGGEFIPGY